MTWITEASPIPTAVTRSFFRNNSTEKAVKDTGDSVLVELVDFFEKKNKVQVLLVFSAEGTGFRL